MKNILHKFGIAIIAMALIWSCGKDDGPSTPPESTKPTITGFTPTSGPVGTVITINGTNFSTTAAENTVKIGSAIATVSNPTATKLSATVPEGAVTGKVSVTVDGEMDTSTDNFTVTVVEPENVAPVFGQASYQFEQPENIGTMDLIGTLSATDEDGDNLSYNITTNDNGLFEINNDGEISLDEEQSLDFEAATEHTITVSVTDGEETVEVEVTIIVQNIPEADPTDPTAFVTVVEGNSVAFLVWENQTYDFMINWGDGTVEHITTESLAGETVVNHNYEAEGEYTVAVNGQVYGFEVSPSFKTVEQWGAIQWQTMERMFNNTNITMINATDAPDLSAGPSMERMFYFAPLFEGGEMNHWDVSKVTDMTQTFNNAPLFNADISGWVPEQVTTMEAMFQGADAFNQDISGWDTGNVQDMSAMFIDTEAFDQDLGSWDIGSVTDMTIMFMGTVGMSAVNFTNTLIGWEAADNTPTDITLDANVPLCDPQAEAAYDSLEINYNWVINFDGTTICN